MPLHLGHHFYGAGNLGDDFMLAGFLAATQRLAPSVTFTCAIPFDPAPPRERFPQVTWLPYSATERGAAIASSDAWLGLGGSPFQHAQSRWFVDHLTADAALCAEHRRPMFFLGIGVQSADELADAAVGQLVRNARAIWTRDAASAARLATAHPGTRITAAADLAHILFATTPPPAATAGRVAIVTNFDYGTWPGQAACLAAIDRLGAREHLWLVQEKRELPGAERALYAALPAPLQARWSLHSPELPGAPLSSVLARWPSPEWLVTSRYHAAIASAWAGSKVVVIATNEKLRAIAAELELPAIPPDADEATVSAALASARPVPHAILASAADRAHAAVRNCLQAVSALR